MTLPYRHLTGQRVTVTLPSTSVTGVLLHDTAVSLWLEVDGSDVFIRLPVVSVEPADV